MAMLNNQRVDTLGLMGFIVVGRLIWLIIKWFFFMGLIMGLLVGGDWNHGILNDFPETVGNGMSSSQLTFTPSFFRGVG